MAEKTGIEWTDSTWSPIRFRVKGNAAMIATAYGYTSLVQIAEKMAGHIGSHCEHISPGCEHCYAGNNNHRCLPGNGTGLPYDRRSRDLVEAFVDEKVLLQPLKWALVTEHTNDCDCEHVLQLAQWKKGRFEKRPRRNECQCPTRPRRIFVENQSDLFGEWVTDEMLDRVFSVMALCRQHEFQVLTKRAERMLRHMTEACTEEGGIRIGKAAAALFHGLDMKDRRLTMAEQAAVSNQFEWKELHHVQFGVSIENQKRANERIPLLSKTPASRRFLSCEPLLGSLEFKPSWINPTRQNDNPISWVIVGGESGPGARPMHPDWARSLRDQCQSAGVPFFFKQWGEWSEVDGGPPNRVFDVDKAHCPIDSKNCVISLDGHVPANEAEMHGDVKYRWMSRTGKKAAGDLLDGEQWHQFPEVTYEA